jgi:hypothetical protein
MHVMTLKASKSINYMHTLSLLEIYRKRETVVSNFSMLDLVTLYA